MNEKFDLLRNLLDELDIIYTEKEIELFSKYYDLLIEWNSHINLTAITDLNEVIIKHFIDSVLVCSFINFDKGASIIDIGSGAGFPGIPIKIMNPDCNVTLLDSLNKRVRFLDNVIGSLGLKNTNTIHGRAEDVSHEKDFRGKFDFSLSRAVANLSTLSEYCIPFLKNGGRFIAYKSDKSEEEINKSKNAIKTLGSRICAVKDITIPESDINRRFIIIENVRPVDDKYPRKAGIPEKKPL